MILSGQLKDSYQAVEQIRHSDDQGLVVQQLVKNLSTVRPISSAYQLSLREKRQKNDYLRLKNLSKDIMKFMS